MELPCHEFIGKFPKKLRQNLKELWMYEPKGLSCMNIKAYVTERKLMQSGDHSQGNSFILEIPYGGKFLSWEIIFNDEDLTFAPDFDFINDQFLLDPDIDTISKYIPTLANWDIKDPKSLINVIQELRKLYKKYQVDKLRENKFVSQYTDYSLLTGDMGISEEDIEVYVDNNDVIHFLIAIKVNFNELPPYIQENTERLLNPGEDFASLKVSFAGSKVTSYLLLSPRLEELIGKCNQRQIPAYSKENGLIEYVPVITKILQDKINGITNHYNLCNEYISTILAYQGNSLLEYDNVTFGSVTVLLEIDGFFAILNVKLGNKFPLEKPTVQLRSICHEKNDGIKANTLNYPYSPKWNVEEMVRKLLVYLKDAIVKFKNESVTPVIVL